MKNGNRDVITQHNEYCLFQTIKLSRNCPVLPSTLVLQEGPVRSCISIAKFFLLANIRLNNKDRAY